MNSVLGEPPNFNMAIDQPSDRIFILKIMNNICDWCVLSS